MISAIAKPVRYSLIVLGLLIVALLIAPFFIDVNSYKSEIEQTVEDATGRKLSIGNINASLFPWIGVELDDVHLANRAGFTDRDFASVKRLDIKLALLPLLSSNVEIEHFEIVDPKIYLERHEDGQSNWDDLAGSSAPSDSSNATTESGKGGSSSPALAALQAESLSITGGELIWADAGSDPVTLSALNLLLNDVQLKRPIGLQLSGNLLDNAFSLDANVGPVGDPGKINVATLPLQGEIKAEKIALKAFKAFIAQWPEQLGSIETATAGLTATVEQRPDGVRVSEGTVSLRSLIKVDAGWKVDASHADAVEVRKFNLLLNDKELFEAKGSVSKLSSAPRFELRVDGKAIERTWLAAFAPELNTLYAAHPTPWKQIRFSSLLAGSPKQLDIRDMQLMLDDDLLQVSGAIVYADPDIRLRVATRELHLDPWLPQPQQAQGGAAEGGATAAEPTPETEPDLRFLKPWRLTAKVQAGVMHLKGLVMEHFNVNINGSNGQFDLNPLRFNLAGGSVTEKASLNAAVFPARWRESVRINDVKVGPLLRNFADLDMLEGTMTMDTDLKATGLTQAGMKTLNGHGKVLLANGKIKGFDLAGAIRKFTNPMATTGAKETDFTQLSGSFKIRNGIASNQDLFMASPLLRVTGKGIVNLVEKQLDYHVKPRVVGTLIGQGDSSPVRRGITVPLHISGPFAAPKVRPEVTADAIIDNAPALLNKGKAGKVLGNILGNKPAQPEQQKQGTEQQAPAEERPEKKLLRGLGGALGF